MPLSRRTLLAATAVTALGSPQPASGRALDEDGTAWSSDDYLRLTNDGGRMVKGQAPLTATRPTPPTVEPPTT